MDTILVVALAALAFLAAIVFCLVITWACADDHPFFGPYKEGRVTFKRVVQAFFRDTADLLEFRRTRAFLLRLWAWWGPRLTNRMLLGVVFADFTIAASGQDVWTWLGQHPLIALGIVLLHLLTPLSPTGAPARIPTSEPYGRGPGAEAEARAAA